MCALCIRLPESKRKEYLEELKQFYFTYRNCPRIPARSMAEILGRLNFAAKTHAGGPFFMSRMWDRFRGVIIDWSRGQVRVAQGVRDVSASEEMWKDIEWWLDSLNSLCAVPLTDDANQRWTVRAGTDGSDWGSGQFVIIHGELEKLQCEWTQYESNDRPINWRELNGGTQNSETVGGAHARIHPMAGCR